MRRVSFAWPVSDGCFARDSSSRRQPRWANQIAASSADASHNALRFGMKGTAAANRCAATVRQER